MKCQTSLTPNKTPQKSPTKNHNSYSKNVPKRRKISRVSCVTSGLGLTSQGCQVKEVPLIHVLWVYVGDGKIPPFESFSGCSGAPGEPSKTIKSFKNLASEMFRIPKTTLFGHENYKNLCFCWFLVPEYQRKQFHKQKLC